MYEIVKNFLIERNENLDRLDQELVKLESEPSSKDLLAALSSRLIKARRRIFAARRSMSFFTRSRASAEPERWLWC